MKPSNFPERRSHTVSSTMRNYTRGATVAFLFLFASNVYVWSSSQRLDREARLAIVESGSVVSVEGCNRDYETITALRQILIDSKAFNANQARRGLISKERAEEAVAYYDTQIARLVLPDCRVARDVLTANPGEVVVKVPMPKYPAKRPAHIPHAKK